MKTRLLAALFLLVVASAHADPIPWDKRFNAYVQGMPKDVVALLDRTSLCHHFGGEPVYDEEREKEIIAARAKYRCDDVDADTKKLLKKYKKNRRVQGKVKGFFEFMTS